MPIKVTDENNNEIEAFTAEEIAQAKAEGVKVGEDAKASAQKEVEAAKSELEKLKKVSAEKTENFKKLNEMSEAEREKFTAKEIEAMKRVEAAENKAKTLEERYSEDTKNRILADKKKALFKYHGGNKELEESLTKNFEMINLPGDTTEIIEERARMAANIVKGGMERNNPLMSVLNGQAPSIKNATKTEEFLKSDKGQKAAKLMDIKDNK